jgi:hypothetical protein
MENHQIDKMQNGSMIFMKLLLKSWGLSICVEKNFDIRIRDLIGAAMQYVDVPHKDLTLIASGHEALYIEAYDSRLFRWWDKSGFRWCVRLCSRVFFSWLPS